MTPYINSIKKRKDPHNNRTTSGQREKIDWLWLAAIVLITFGFWFPTLRNCLVDWDDNIYILNNPYIFSLTPENIGQIFSEYFMANYHPLTMLSYAIEYAIAGDSPFIYHLTNLILHLINTVLIYFFVRNLFRIVYSNSGSRQSQTIALVTAFLFGLHPMHVESVSWVSERKDVLYGFFFLLALIKYVRYISTNRTIDYLLCVVFFVLSLLSKGMAVSLALSLVAIDFVLKRKLFSPKVLLEKVPFFILALVFGIVAILAQKSGDAIITNLGLPDKISFASYAQIGRAHV